MTITIEHAWTQRGWSANDYMIDDSRMAEIIGRSYRTAEHAMRAARARADELGYAAIRYRTSDGEVWERGDEPSIPGRPALCRRVVSR